MSNEAIRAAFEAWWKSIYRMPEEDKHGAWAAWQASRKVAYQAGIEDELLEALKEVMEHYPFPKSVIASNARYTIARVSKEIGKTKLEINVADDMEVHDARLFRWLRDNPTNPSTPYYDDGKWVVPYLVSGCGLGGGVGGRVFNSLDAATEYAMLGQRVTNEL